MATGNESRAKVFISCGQAEGTNERTIAGEIAGVLEERGFDPYIATEEQTLRGLRDNIFRNLQESEYFLFVDFKRERVHGDEERHRGSLFSHQELAIASYLEIDVIAFREEGVELGGVMAFLQMNAITFRDRGNLSRVVLGEVVRRGWQPNWKNQLRTLSPKVHSQRTSLKLPSEPHSKIVRFWHVPVENRHVSETAVNCYVYLERVVDCSINAEIPRKTVELRWSGYDFPNALIGPKGVREFDAFFLMPNRPDVAQLWAHSGSLEYARPIIGPGDFELTYKVVSSNFLPATATFLLHLDSDLDQVQLTPVE